VSDQPLERFACHRQSEHPARDRQRDEREHAEAHRGDRGESRIDLGAKSSGGLLPLQNVDEHRRDAPGELLDELRTKAAALGEHFLHDQLWHPRVLRERLHVEPDQHAHVGRLTGTLREQPLERLAERPGGRLEHGPVQTELVAEIVVNHGGVDAGRRGDLADRHRCETAREEQLPRGVEQRCAYGCIADGRTAARARSAPRPFGLG
jgi:hypothetical protein